MTLTTMRIMKSKPCYEVNDFYNTQGSVYLTEKNDMSVLFSAINALKEIDWFRKSVRDIRAFRVEDWSDFTQFFKV